MSEAEKKLLSMRADYKNIKIHINKLLYKNQTEDYELKPITASDPAFYTSDLHVIDHVRTPEKLNKFIDLLVEEAVYLAPETTKLKAAIAMKKAEIGNYVQKFFMPNAMLSYEYGSQFDRHLPYQTEGNLQMAPTYISSGGLLGTPWLNLNTTSSRFMIIKGNQILRKVKCGRKWVLESYSRNIPSIANQKK